MLQKAFSFLTENTLGSFGFLSSFNSIGGEKNGWNYYAFFQRKKGDGWRANESFFQNTAYAKVSKEGSRCGPRKWGSSAHAIGCETNVANVLCRQGES